MADPEITSDQRVALAHRNRRIREARAVLSRRMRIIALRLELQAEELALVAPANTDDTDPRQLSAQLVALSAALGSTRQLATDMETVASIIEGEHDAGSDDLGAAVGLSREQG